MATEINLPVRLQVIQDSISEFKKILDSLQPNTTGWKAMNKLITQMTAQAEKLQVQLSKPFSSQSQFNQTDKTIEKLEDAATRVQIVMDSLKFSDIKLTPTQTAEFEKFKKEIDDIGAEYNKLKEQIKQGFLDQGNNRNLIGGLDKKALEGDLESIQAAVDKHVSKLEDSVKKQNEAFNKLRSQVELGSRAKILTSTDQGLTREALGDKIFDKYLTGSGESLKLKLGKGISKANLLKEIEEAFNLQPGDLNSLADKTIKQINEAFQKMGERGQINPFSGIIKNGREKEAKQPLLTAEIEDLKEQIGIYKGLQEELKQLQQSDTLTTAQTSNNTRIEEITTQMNTLRNTILSNIATNESYKNSMNSMRSGFSQLRGDLSQINAEFLKQQAAMQSFNSLKMTIANFMGFAQVLNLTKQAISSAANHIKELDTVMNKISIVTNMSTSDLWGQIDQYSSLAQRYGTTIKGAYEVSQIYYQQGLETSDVLTLTNETLKLARISGMDYAKTTDYMTTAIRGFKMEMSEASTVVDVYSNLAANTAVSQEELAIAMSKTASSLQSVGATFQEASAMIATMVAVTRESSTNIGSALKSIASRYGELTKDPTALTDSEGETMSFNKVDQALQSVGISMKTAEGQFREFTDVIIELGEKWDQLESVQQRYIATQFAGNRQQSRFLALVSNVDLLKENISNAENSEDVGTVQALKALDSLDAKLEQVQVAYQQFYTTLGVENVWKGFLDGAKSVINTLNGMPKLFGALPISAINAIASAIVTIKNLAFSGLAKISNQIMPLINSGANSAAPAAKSAGERIATSLIEGMKNTLRKGRGTVREELNYYMQQGYVGSAKITSGSLTQFNKWEEQLQAANSLESRDYGKAHDARAMIGQQMVNAGYLNEAALSTFANSGEEANRMLAAFIAQAQLAQTRAQQLSNGLQGVSSIFTTLALVMNTATLDGKRAAGAFTFMGGALMGVSAIVKMVDSQFKTIPWYAIASAVTAMITGVIQIAQSISLEARLEEATEKAEELSDKAKELKADYQTINSSVKKLQELEKTRKDNTEAAEEYQEAVDKLAETFPHLVESYDENNQAVLNASAMEQVLTEARDESALATLRAAEAERKVAELNTEKLTKDFKTSTSKNEFQGTKERFIGEEQIFDQNGQPVISPYVRWGAIEGYFDDDTLAIFDSYIYKQDEFVPLMQQFSDYLDRMFKAGNAGDADAYLKAQTELLTFAGDKGWNFTESFNNLLIEAEGAAQALKSNQSTIKAVNTVGVDSWMKLTYGNKKNTAFGRSPELLQAATSVLNSTIASEEKPDYSRTHLSSKANELFGSIDSLLVGVSDERVTEIGEILANHDSYTYEDFQGLVKELDNVEWLEEYFTNTIKYNTKWLQGKCEDLNNEYKESTDEEKALKLSEEQVQKFQNIIGDGVTLDERNLINAGINQAQAIAANQQDATDFIEYFTQFYSEINDLGPELRNAIIKNFIENGFSKEGLQRTLSWIETNNGINHEQHPFEGLKNMIDSFIPNVSLAVNAMFSTFNEDLGDITSLFSDLTKGVKSSKIEEVKKTAEKYGITLGDINSGNWLVDGENFIYAADQIDTIVAQLHERYTTGLETIQDWDAEYYKLFGEELDEDGKVIGKIWDLESAPKSVETILGSRYSEFYDETGNLRTDKTETDVQNAIEEQYSETREGLENYYNWLGLIEAQLAKNSKWSQGDYSSLFETSKLKGVENEEGVMKRIRELASDKNAWEKEELEDPEVVNSVSNYQSGLKTLVSDITTNNIDYLKNRTNSYKGVSSEIVQEIYTKVSSGEMTLIEALRTYGLEAGMSVNEINQAVIDNISSKYGQQNAVAGMMSGRTTSLSDLKTYVEKYKPNGSDKLDSFIDNNGNLIGKLGEVYDLDEYTGELKLKQKVSFESVVKAYEEAFHITIKEGTELYNQMYDQWVSDTVNYLNEQDAGLRTTSVLSSFGNANLGERVDLSKSPQFIQLLKNKGEQINDGIYTITSEMARDAILLSITEEDMQGWDAEATAWVRDKQKQIKKTRAKSTVISGLMKETVDQSAIDSLMVMIGKDPEKMTAEAIQDTAKTYGFIFNEATQQYYANETALTSYDNWIKQLDPKKDAKLIQDLTIQREKLATLLEKDKKKDSLNNILSNYNNISQDAFDEFQALFGDDYNKYFVTDATGQTSLVDFEGFYSDLSSTYGDILNEYIAQIGDTYASNITKASDMVISGTTSFADMKSFGKQYKEATGKVLSTDAFKYNDILDSWTLNPQIMEDFVRVQAQSLVNQGILAQNEFESYVKDRTSEAIAEAIDFNAFFKASKSDAKTAAKTREAIKNYYATSLTGLESIKKDDYIEEAKKFGVDEKYLDETAAQLAENARKRNEGKIKKAADASMANLKAGGQPAIDEMAKISGGIENLSTDEIEAAYRYQIQPLVEIGEKLDSLEKGSVISQDAAKILNTIDGFSVSAAGVVESVGNLQNAYQKILNNMIATGNATVTDLNTLAKAQLNNKYKKNKTLSDTLSQGTISTDSLIDMYETATGKVFGAYESQRYNGSMRETYTAIDADKELQNWIKEGLVSVDKLGNVSIKNFSGVATKMGWEAGTKEYEDGYSAWVDAKIAENQKTKSKRAQAQISNLISGNVGDEINVSDLDASMKEALGITGDTYTILSEYQRDSMIMALDTATIANEATRKAVEEAQNEIKQKRNKNTGLQGIIAKNITKDNMKAFMDSIGYGNQTNIDAWAKAFGFEYDAWTDSFNATINTISHIHNQIALAKQTGSGATAEDIANLEILANQLEQELAVDPAKEALKDLLNNYTDVTSQIAVFKAYFGDKVNIDQFVDTDAQGRQSVRIDELRTALSAAGYAYDDIFGEFIAKLTDEYINNAKKAGTLIAQGTTSYSEIDTFRTEFTKLTGNTFDIYYDSLLEGFTYDAEYLRQYVTAAADKIGFNSDEGKKQWIEDQIDAITVDNLDFSKILNGTATSKERATLTRDLQNYVRTHLNKFNSADYLNSENFVEQQAEEILQLVSLGGQVAINAIKSTGKELTTEEISAAYRNQIEPLASLAEQLPNLEKGSVVAKNQIEALRMAGFNVNADGVIQAVGDLVAAYRGIYWQMKNTGEATVAELNAVVGHLLDNRDGEQQAIDAISNASSMTYSQLADIYTNAGVQLTEEMVNQMQKEGTLRALGGNKVMISNFEKFAEGMGWEPDSEEYFSALKTYRSNMIEYNNKIGSEIKSEFEAVSNAKLGDKVNISRTIQQYGEELFKDLDVNIKDGILTISSTAQLPQIALRIATAAMQAGGMIEDELLNFIASIEDGIISGITSATDFSLNGTDSFASMQEFVNKYNQIFTDSQIDMSSFYYDTLFDTFKLDSSVLNKYIESQKAELKQYGLSDELIDTYIQDQTVKLAREAISVDDLLNANDTNRGREAAKLSSAIQSYFDITGQDYIESAVQQRLREQINYYTEVEKTASSKKAATIAHQKVEELQNQLSELSVESIVNALYQGGEEGVKWLKELKPEATSEEISNVYNASINRLRDAYDQLGKGVGETVSGLAANIIRTTSGFKYQEIGNGDIVIEAVGDMVEAYNILYAQMSNNAQKTKSDLNSLYADILTAEDQQNIDIINTLQKGPMNYHEFGDLLTQYYDGTYEEFMRDITNGVERDGFGNIRIIDWESFAKKIFNTDNLAEIANTDEYISAYKAYVDGIISLNKNIEQEIVNEIKQIENAKAGDWLNLGTFWTKITTGINEAIENVEPEWYNGNVKNLGHRVRVPGSIMAEYFSEYGDNPEDYSTIYGMPLASRSFAETVENMGMTFASLDEEGNAVTDLEDYVRHLFKIAEEQAHGSDNITAAMIKELDAQNRNLLLHIGVFENSLSISEVLEKEYAFTDELHNRDADASWFGHLQDRLQNFGATLEDGILKIGDNANLLGIAETLEFMAERAGLELGEGLEQVQDSVKAVLDSIREAIVKGISGGLTGEEQDNLFDITDSLGVEIGFNQTKEGFKLTTQSAKELYFALSQINSLQGELLFDEMKDSLIEAETHFQTVQETTTYIIELQNELNALRAQEDPVKNGERIASLENELALAEKINRVRSIDSQDDSFNFMNGEIPEGQNNPLNYWKNWGQAFSAMKEAGKASGKAKNTMAYEDFYNIVSEIGRLAELSGKAVTLGDTTVDNCQSAADLITKAAGALKNVDGEMKIDLSKINIDFSSGLTELGNQIDEQVDALADEQIAMIDSLIAVLEIIVAMEALEDVDTDKNLTLDFSELGIEVDGAKNIISINDNLKGVVTQLLSLDATLEDGTNVFDALTISTDKASFSFSEFLENWNNLDWLSANGITADVFSNLFNNFYKISKSDEFDRNHPAESLLNILNQMDWSNLSLTMNSGNHILNINDSGIYQVNWASADYDNYRTVFKDEKNKKDEEIRKELQQIINEEIENGEISVNTHRKIKVLENDITLITDPKNKNYGKYKAGNHNQYYGTIGEAVAASDLFDLGAQVKDITVTGTGDDAFATGQIKIGKFTFDVESRQQGGKFKYDNQEFTTQQQLMDYVFNKETKEPGQEKSTVDHTSAAYKEWEVQSGISVKPVFNVNGKVGDVSKNTTLREAISKTIGSWEEEVKNGKVQFGKDNKTIEVELANGIKATLPADGLTLDDGSIDYSAVKQQLTEQLSIDESLKATIVSAMGEAFTTLKSQLSEITPGELPAVANALARIVTQANKLQSIDWSKIAEGLSSLNPPEGENKKGSDSSTKVSTETSISNEEGGTITTKAEIDVSEYNAGMDQLEAKTEDATGSVNSHVDTLKKNVITAGTEIKAQFGSLQEHISITWEINIESSSQFINDLLGGNVAGAGSGYETYSTMNVDGNTEPAESSAEAAQGKIDTMSATITITAANETQSGVEAALSTLAKLPTHKTIHIDSVNGGSDQATGNFAMAQGTLMGELGPELVVSNGRYFIAGQNGAEFVNLNSDAIVFNHLQTEQLLKNGMSSTRGRAVTNERNAVAFASGNMNGGPAMASASAALAALKELRAMWESLKSASVSDLAAGGGGGGGGGGDKIVDPKAWVDTVERWYNLTQLIARLEKEITHEQALRTKLQSDFQKDGRAYYKSQKLSLGALKEQIAAQEELNLSRREYYDKRVEALKKSELGKIYTFDEEGQLKFRKDVNLNGYTDAMEFLTNLYGFNDLGKANYTNKEKYNLLQQLGFGNYMLYDSNGMEIKADSDNDGEITDEEWESYYEAATEAFRDKMDEYASSNQSLWDQIQDGEVDLLELQNTANELLNEMRENQLDLEDKVLSAIEESRQRQIDDLQEERDALEESTGKFIDGLSDSLQKERDLYQNQEDKRELSRLKRQRDILARSGGTAAQISDLDNEIASKSQDMYFEMQQKQIDAIQEASDLEIERLDNQINIMTETLEYQKKYGLLWEAVYEKMDMSAAELTNFINTYSEEVWSKSPLATEQTINDTLFSAQQWEEFRNDVEIIRDLTLATNMAKDYETYDKAMKAEFGDSYDPTGKYKNKFTEVYKDTRDITKASEAARKLYHDDQKAKADEEARKRAEQARWAAMNAASSSNSSSSSTGSTKSEPVCTGYTSWESNSTHHWRYSKWSDGSRNKTNYEIHNFVNGKCSKCGYNIKPNANKPAEKQQEKKQSASSGNGKVTMMERASGGITNGPEITLLGEKGDEAVFTASQTKILRDNILSNKPNSLISLLATYNQAYKDGVLPTTNNTQSLVIENATVNMNVSQISNDYDARRAGEQALEEIMRIARKTGATNSVRR